MSGTELLKPTYAHNMRLIGHSDRAGRSDGQQIMARNGYAYIGHVCSKGFSVIDVRDPRSPKTVSYIQIRRTPGPPPPGSRRSAAARARPRHVFASRNGRRAKLLQAEVRHARRPRASAGARLVGRNGRIRYFAVRRAAADRLHASRAPASTGSGTSAGGGPMRPR